VGAFRANKEVKSLKAAGLDYDFSTYAKSPNVVTLDHIGVNEESRGNGMASRGLQILTELADSHGVFLDLEVGHDDQGIDLVAWYMRHGFFWGTGFMKRTPLHPSTEVQRSFKQSQAGGARFISFSDSASHVHALRDAIKLSNISDSSTLPEGAKTAVTKCLAFIENRVLLSGDELGALDRLVINNDWGMYPEMRDLFSAYVKAGYIDVDAPMTQIGRLFPEGSIPLEAAIIIGNVSAFKALLQNEADEARVPSPATPGVHVRDIIDFINIYQPHEETKHQLIATLTEHRMERQIAMTLDANVSKTESPRRRMSV